ncbi:MAG TPA: hypothetical protein V6D10_03155 [Trichocoleus sp.]
MLPTSVKRSDRAICLKDEPLQAMSDMAITNNKGTGRMPAAYRSLQPGEGGCRYVENYVENCYALISVPRAKMHQ